jgi:uncharacterized protein
VALLTPGLWVLIAAGVGAGLCGSVAGLASIVSYPALLGYGLSPMSANVSNTLAMFATTVGSGLSSRRELRGQRPRLLVLMAQSACGGLMGAALLLFTPGEAFEAVVPWLVALGAALLLSRDRLQTWVLDRRTPPPGRTRGRAWLWPGLLVVVGIYGGYFGAGVGVILLAVLAVRTIEPLAVTNAIKNIGSGTANAAASITYVALAPVNWPAVLALGTGALVGSSLGPRLVRVLPERPLRYAVAAAGFALATYLAVG